MKRAYKLQEFVAHTSNVNCLKVGRKSAGVLVTGGEDGLQSQGTNLPVQWQHKPTVMFFLTTGEDKKVNVWAIGKPTAVLVGFALAIDVWCMPQLPSCEIDRLEYLAELVWAPESSGVCLL
jgi:hypothetical protein